MEIMAVIDRMYTWATMAVVYTVTTKERTNVKISTAELNHKIK